MQRSGTSVRVELDSPSKLRLVLGAMLTGLVLFSGLAAMIGRAELFGDSNLAPLFALVLGGIGLALWGTSTAVGRAMGGVSGDDRKRALTLVLVRGAFAEAFGLLGATFTLITADVRFLLAPLLASFVLMRLARAAGEASPRGPGNGPSSSSHPIEP